MFRIEDKNIQYGFKILGDNKERGAFLHDLQNNNPDFFLFLLGQDLRGGLREAVGKAAVQPYHKKAGAQENIAREEQINFCHVLFFSLGVIASANGNRGWGVKDPPAPSENPEFAYWLPDLKINEIKKWIDRCDEKDEKITNEVAQEALDKIRTLNPLFILRMLGLIWAFNLNEYSRACVYIITCLFLYRTKEVYEWQERTFK